MHCTNEEVGQSKADAKVVQKECLEFKNNTVDRTTFLVWPACWPEP